MANLKDLRLRITSVKSTQKITSAMKMVAASKLRRAQTAAEEGRPYAERMERMLSALISSLPSGILVTFDGTDHHRLSDEVYEKVCKATKLIPQRAIMGANFLNFRAHEIYTINGNKIDETFVEWDEEKNKCFAGFTVSGNNVGVDEKIKVSGEALSFLSTGIDTRIYYIKNF